MKCCLVIAALFTLVSVPAAAQRSLDLTVNDVGIAIGDAPRVKGLRINFRDRYLEAVDGINVTVWTPYEHTGVVRGLAIGLPMTGARRIEGIAVGLFGLGAEESIRGLAIGGIGMGVGESFEGIAIGGIGMGAGQDFRGIAIAGIGAGAGGSFEGLAVSGIGVGAGGDAKGILIGGIGAGVGGNMRGLSIAGVGLGAGGNVEGITVTGLGLGAGGNVTGVQLSGIGMGVGGTLKWVSVAGLGIGAPRIEGVAVAAAVGTQEGRGLIIAPGYFRVGNGGMMRGVNMSAYNDVRGTQRGLAIGIFNYARHLDGVQVGLLNYAGNKPRGTRLLPILNFSRGR